LYNFIKKWGNNIYYSIKNEKGETEYKIDRNFKPFIFVKCNKETEWKSYPDNQNVMKITFNSIAEYKESIGSYPKDLIYGDIPTMMEVQKIRQDKLNDDYDVSKLNISFFDIEVFSSDGFPDPSLADSEITSITIQDKRTKHYTTFTFLDGYKKHINNITLYTFNNEISMLRSFCYWLAQANIDVFLGWNSDWFDVPYIVNRCKMVIPKEYKKMSPFGIVSDRTISEKSRKVDTGEIFGIVNMDLLQLYKKYSQNSRDSYSLNNIAGYELKDQKIDYTDEGTLNDLMIKDPQKYIEYNIKDVELTTEIDNKCNHTSAAYALAYYVGADPTKNFANTALWDIFLYNKLLDMNMVPPVKKSNPDVDFIGAFVDDPEYKLHKWILSYDLNSLYPHLIAQYNISPETKVSMKDIPTENMRNIVREIRKNDIETNIKDFVNLKYDLSEFRKHKISVTPNGACFDCSYQGLVPKLMMDLYDDRKEHKKEGINYSIKAQDETDPIKKKEYETLSENLDSLQLAEKIFLNSGYGFFTYKNSRYFDVEIAEAITSTGQVSIRFAKKEIDIYLNKLFNTTDSYVKYCDTDSNYVCLERVVDKIKHNNPSTKEIVSYLVNFSQKVMEPKIEQIYDKLANNLSVYENKMVMKSEVVAERAFWVSKKKYAMKVWWCEGKTYKKYDLKVMGMQIKRSDTPKLIRDELSKCVDMILNEQDVWNYIDSVKDYFMSLTPEQIALGKGTKGIQKYSSILITDELVKKISKSNKNILDILGPIHDMYISRTPMHDRASILHNYLVAKKKLLNVRLIKVNDKMKYVYLKNINPIRENVIGFIDKLPEEFGLNEYIDYEKQYMVAFLKPISDILKTIGIERPEKVVGGLW